MTDWDALLWLDSDTAVAAPLASVFHLPSPFLGTLDVARSHRRQAALLPGSFAVLVRKRAKARGVLVMLGWRRVCNRVTPPAAAVCCAGPVHAPVLGPEQI